MTDVALPAVHAGHGLPQVVQDRAVAAEQQVPRAAGPAHSPAPAMVCARTSGCQCVDCGLSSAGVPKLPAVTLGRTQHFGQSSAKAGRRRGGPTPMLAGAGGARRRRRLAKQKRRQRQPDENEESPDPWQPAPRRDTPVDKMALLRGRRPRAMKLTRPHAEPTQVESGQSTIVDAQGVKPLWLQSDLPTTDSVEQRETETPHLNLARCSGCSRRFKPDRLGRHEATCQGKKSKRATFDSKSRALPKEALQASITRQSSSAGSSEESLGGAKSTRKTPRKKAKWKQQHEEFQAMLRSSGSVRDSRSAGAGEKGVEPATDSLDDRVACPHCNRKFNQEVADRHIPRCADVKAKPNGMLKKGGGKCASAVGAGTTAERHSPSESESKSKSKSKSKKRR
jgi:hypothetical protein